MRTGLGTLLARPTASRASLQLVSLRPTGTLYSTRPPAPPSSTAAEDVPAVKSAPRSGPRIRYAHQSEPPLIRKPESNRSRNGHPPLLPPSAATRTHAAEPVDLEPWLRLLKRVQRQGPLEEIESTWYAMRAQDVDLPCEGRYAPSFWRAFLRRMPLRDAVFEHAVYLKDEKNQVWLPLYEVFMHRLLRESLPSTLEWHTKFKDHYYIPSTALNGVVVAATSSSQSLEYFKWIYLDLKTGSNSAYDAMITALCNQNRMKEALDMHDFLVGHADLPSAALKQSPMMEHFQRFGNSLSLAALVETNRPRVRGAPGVEVPAVPSGSASVQPLAEPLAPIPKGVITVVTSDESVDPANGTPTRKGSDEIVDTSADGPADSEFHFSREVMYTFLGRSHGISPKQFSDEFCARLFATKAFSISLVISCLNMFGVRSIGPTALREMALRAFYPREVTAKIVDLERAGISIGDSVFSRAVKKLSSDANEDLLHSLLHSDQHPDVLEDVPLQRTLLSSYLAQDDWLSVYRTLTLLSLFHDDPPQESWNILVRQYARARNVDKVQQVLEDMRVKGIRVTSHTVDRLFSHLLIKRFAGKEPSTVDHYTKDDLRLVTNICLRFMETGQLLPAHYWQELIIRYGMSGRFEELSRLCIRLTTYYSQGWLEVNSRWILRAVIPANDPLVTRGTIDPKATVVLPRRNRAHPLRRIFSDQTIRAIIEWGFKSGFKDLRAQPDRIRYYFMQANLRPRTDDFHWPADINPLHPEATYLRGVTLVQDLVERGVYVKLSVIRKTIKYRLWHLFSPGISARKANQMAQKLNPHSLEDILRAILQHWKGPPLFPQLLVNRLQVEQQVNRIMARRKSMFRGLEGRADSHGAPTNDLNRQMRSGKQKKPPPVLPIANSALASRPASTRPAWKDPFDDAVPTSLPLIGLPSESQQPSPNSLWRELFENASPSPLPPIETSPATQPPSTTALESRFEVAERPSNNPKHSILTEGTTRETVESSLEDEDCPLEDPTVSAVTSVDHAKGLNCSVFKQAWEDSFEDESSSLFSPTKLPRPKFPRFPTILDHLDESAAHGSVVNEEKIQRREQVAFAMFGRAPVIGGPRSRFGRIRLDQATWERTVGGWARGSDYKTKKFPRLFALRSMGSGREQMVGAIERRRNRQLRLVREEEQVARERDSGRAGRGQIEEV